MSLSSKFSALWKFRLSDRSAPSSQVTRCGIAGGLASLSMMSAAFGAGVPTHHPNTPPILPSSDSHSRVVEEVDQFQLAGGAVEVRVDPARLTDPAKIVSLAVVTSLLEFASEAEDPAAVGENFQQLSEAVAAQQTAEREAEEPAASADPRAQLEEPLSAPSLSVVTKEVPGGSSAITEIPSIILAEPAPEPESPAEPVKPELEAAAGPLAPADWFVDPTAIPDEEQAPAQTAEPEAPVATVDTEVIEEVAEVIETFELPTTIEELRQFQRMRGLPEEGDFESPVVAQQIARAMAGGQVLVEEEYAPNTPEENAEKLARVVGAEGVAELRERLGVPEPTASDITEAAEKRGDEIVDGPFIDALSRKLERRGVELNEKGLAEFRHNNGLGSGPKMDAATADALVGLSTAKYGQTVGVDAQLLREVMPRLSPELAKAYVPHLNASLREFNIDTPPRVAAYLAQLAHESVQLRYFEEIASGAAYEGRRDLGNTEPGDGVRFKGRGPIQLTGRSNYERTSLALFGDRRLLDDPELAEDPSVAFRIAGLYWQSRELNKYADAGEFDAITYRINGGFNGKADRDRYYVQAREAVADGLVLNAPVALG